MPTPTKPKIPRIPEMVGATTEPFYLGSVPHHIILAIHEPTGPAHPSAAELQDWEPRRVFLNVENITSAEWAPAYDVYLNLPLNDRPDEHPELYAGELPMFGLVESSRSYGNHAPNGLYEQLDVTGLYGRLPLLAGWDPRNLRISFVPRKTTVTPKVRVGRVSLYFA